MKLRRVLATLLILQFCLSGIAQQPSRTPASAPQPPVQAPQQPTKQTDDDVVRITTNLVQVDAVITDNKGRLVTDLRPEEVEIREDGESQSITNFSFVSLDSGELRRQEPSRPVDKTAPPAPPVRLRPEQIRRTMALVVDDLGLSFESTFSVRQALRNYLDKQMEPNDLVAIIRTSGGIGALQQFTTDKRQLYAAVEKVKWNPQGRGNISAFEPVRAGSREQSSDDRLLDRGGEDDEFREELFSVGTLGALSYVVRGLKDLPGRKSVLLFSDGLRIYDRSDLSRGTRIRDRLQNLTDLANRSSVVLYTLDARGLPFIGWTAADNTLDMTPEQMDRITTARINALFDSQQGLAYLANQTGGLAIRNANDLKNGIRKAIDDQKGYYLIGYRPADDTFDRVSGRRKFHKLSLKVLRPGKFNVRMRTGFFGITDEEREAPRLTGLQQLISGLVSPFGAAGVNLRLTSVYASDPKVGSIMRSFLHINGRDLSFTKEADGWYKTDFKILAVTFGDNGTVVDELARTQSMRISGRAYERVMNEGFTYNLVVPIKKPGAYQLRTALLDEKSGRVGAATQFIEVPNIKKNRLVVSGVLVRGKTLEAFNAPSERAPTQEDATDDSNEEGTPPGAGVAVRRFERGFVLEYGYAVYNAQLDANRTPKVQTQVRLFRNGKEVFTGETKPLDPKNQPDLKRLVAGGAMQLGADMEPGEYVLQVLAHDPLAKEKHRTATQWIDFEIVK